ncbi:MAG: hypothetical protein AB7E05_10750 [Sphingobium sp.]
MSDALTYVPSTASLRVIIGPVNPEALAFHIERHGNTVWHRHKAITGPS